MKNITLTRLYLENYKLFERITLDFKNGLNVFDGPNGYGKTSIFDAIEFLITGTIKRIVENTAINGVLKYDEIFLANDSSKDVIIKAEFNVVDEDKTNRKVVIAKQVLSAEGELGAVNCNPKKLGEITNTYVIEDFETEELKQNCIISKQDLEKYQKELFGETSQNLFFMLYYVKQEDRLDFFKNSEKERVKTIDSLFQIKTEQEKLKDINDGKKNLKSVIDLLENEIKILSENQSKNLDGIIGPETEYIKLLPKDASWDLETVEINNVEILNNALHQLKGIKSLVNNVGTYKEELKNKECQKFLDLVQEERTLNLRVFCLYSEIADDLEKFVEKQHSMKILTNQKKLADEGKFYEISYETLYNLLNIDNSDNVIDNLSQLITDYRQNKELSISSQQTLSDMIRIRQQLLDEVKNCKDEISNTECPYCGFDWKDAAIFAKNIEITSKRLSKLVNGSEKKCIEIINVLKDIYEKQLLNRLEKEIEIYNSESLLIEFDQIHSKESLQKYENVKVLMKKIGLDFSVYNYRVERAKEIFESIEKDINDKITLLPAEYENDKTVYKFSQIIDLYFNSIQDVEGINKEDIDKKILYLHYKFLISQNELTVKITKLTTLKEHLVKEVQKDVDNYMKAWKKCISKYQAQIISKIEIPFYIYSARILQSYQGGQGIFIRQAKNSSKGEVDSIRFTSPEQQHDVLYTMSSGQLSGVLLSFSLALNKTFAKDGLNAIFIDDPVQCMDDLNIVSFVELLRCEFESSQLLISTHEKSFANYILYKYKKHGLERKNINLKEIAN